MKRIGKIVLAVILVSGGAFAYAERGTIRDWWFELNRPTLPAAAKYVPPSATSDARLQTPEPSVVEGGVATSEHYVLVSSPPTTPKSKPVDPFEEKGPLPAEANLAVPFTSQAPTGDWSLPYQEACEEASAIMVDAYYHGATGKILPDQAKQAIDNLVAFEKKFLGFYESTTAAETAALIKAYFNYSTVLVQPITGAGQIKRAIANGYPVIIPAAGKLLGNPNYRNGGPLYHMLVVKGYTKDRFITNDAGTRLGADYTYPFDTVLTAAHDWNGGKVTEGAPVLIVIVPNPS